MANRNFQMTMLSNASADSAAMAWPGGSGVITGEATWGGGNIKLQMQTVNGTWIDVSASSHTLSANGQFAFTLPKCQIKLVRTTATAIYAYVHGTDFE
jgi:hypothetical protein